MELRAWWEQQLGPIRWQADGNGMAPCPFHEDGTASLSVHRARGVWYCFAGCGGGTVGEFARRRGVDPPGGAGGAAEAEYDYRDGTGALLYQVVRLPGKRFAQRRPAGAGGWVWDLQHVPRVLYRLPELLDSGDPVYVVEGEKDVETLRALGLTATTNSGGAGKWRDEYSPLLRGRVCILVPDNDEPGRHHMAGVARSLGPYAAELVTVELPGLPEKGDVSEWLGQGHTVEELGALVEETRKAAARPAGAGAGAVEAEPPRRGHEGRAPEPTLAAWLPERGWLREYVEYGLSVTDAPVSYHVFAGLSCVALALGRRVWLPYGEEGLYPNLYVCLLGPSARARKSTVLAIARKLLGRFDEHAILPEQFSAERFYEVLAQRPTSACVWPELGAMLRYFDRSYMVGMKEDLTQLYDCPPVFRRALKSGAVEVKGPALSILAASTPAWLLGNMREVDLVGGFFPRFLYVFVDAWRPRYPRPPAGDAARLNALVEGLQRVKRCGGAVDLGAGWTAFEAWEARLAEAQARVGEDDLYGVFLGRLPAQVLKLALCLHAAEGEGPTVAAQTVGRACALGDWLRAQLAQAVRRELALNPRERQRNRVLALIAREPGIDRARLVRLSHLSAKELDEHLATLEEGAQVHHQGGGVRANPFTYSPGPAG